MGGSVSGLNGSPGASATIGAEGGGAEEINHFPANGHYICTLCQLSLYSMSEANSVPCQAGL